MLFGTETHCVLFTTGVGGAAVGVVLTVLIYLALIVLTVFLIYRYVLHIHLNGRMLDVYHRILGEDSAFFLPQDLEISALEVRAIVEKAEKWRGMNGERYDFGAACSSWFESCHVCSKSF